MKEELQILRDKTKVLTKKVQSGNTMSSKKSKINTKAIPNQNCDFDICMDEDCVDTAQVNISNLSVNKKNPLSPIS